jgi:hypothetical protein
LDGASPKIACGSTEAGTVQIFSNMVSGRASEG